MNESSADPATGEPRRVVDPQTGLAYLREGRAWSHPETAAILLPGAQCEAHRYGWLLRDLAESDIACLAIDPPLVERPSMTNASQVEAVRLVSIGELATALRLLASAGARQIIVIGHSYGGTVLLDALDPEEARRNPMHELGQSLSGLPRIAGGITLGTSLQPELLGLHRPWRHASRRLHRPAATPLLMVAASSDGLVPPDAVRATAERYSPPARYTLIEGGNHFGWTGHPGPQDRNDLDGPATISAEQQQAATASLCREFIDDVKSCG